MSDGATGSKIPDAFLSVRPEWLALQAEETVLEPDLPIVDPHHHLMDMRGHQYMLPGLPGRRCHGAPAGCFALRRVPRLLSAPGSGRPQIPWRD